MRLVTAVFHTWRRSLSDLISPYANTSRRTYFFSAMYSDNIIKGSHSCIMGFSIDLFISKFGRCHGLVVIHMLLFFLGLVVIHLLLFFSFYLLFSLILFVPVLWDFVLGRIFDLTSPKFTLKKLSTSSLRRGFRILHTLKGPCWPESHEANDYIGHILVFLWLHHTDPLGTTDQSGFMVTLTTNQISHFTPVWIF